MSLLNEPDQQTNRTAVFPQIAQDRKRGNPDPANKTFQEPNKLEQPIAAAPERASHAGAIAVYSGFCAGNS
jgi:hypothetical protein